jgi:hypothetical protein
VGRAHDFVGNQRKPTDQREARADFLQGNDRFLELLA